MWFVTFITKKMQLLYLFGSFASTSNNFLSQYPLFGDEFLAFFITVSISRRLPAGKLGSLEKKTKIWKCTIKNKQRTYHLSSAAAVYYPCVVLKKPTKIWNGVLCENLFSLMTSRSEQVNLMNIHHFLVYPQHCKYFRNGKVLSTVRNTTLKNHSNRNKKSTNPNQRKTKFSTLPRTTSLKKIQTTQNTVSKVWNRSFFLWSRKINTQTKHNPGTADEKYE